MAFLNRVRLPFYVTQPQWNDDVKKFTLANGASKITSVRVSKIYKGKTDYLGEALLEKLKIALIHDTVNIEGDRYLGGVVQEGRFETAYIDFMDFPLGQAQFELMVTPYNIINDNCQTCDEAVQLNLVDDSIGAIDEGDTGSVLVFENDSICCSPIVAAIMSFNTTYLSAATIDATTGEVVLTAKNPAPSTPGAPVVLATYRVTCPNGGYDEADVYGEIVGSSAVCQPPTGLTYVHEEAMVDRVEFTPSISTPDTYEWKLYECDNLGTPVDSGTTAASPIEFTTLVPGICYVVTIKSICDDMDSEVVQVEFTVPSDEATTSCGRFSVINTGYPGVPYVTVTYINCAGTFQTKNVVIGEEICMLVDGDLNPVYFAEVGGTSAERTYAGVCATGVAITSSWATLLVDVCAAPGQTFYVAAPATDVAVGVRVYTDIELLTPVGAGYITNVASDIFKINGVGLVTLETGTC